MSDRQTSKKNGRDTSAAPRLAVAGTVRQKTLNGPVQCSGVGLHGGAPVSMTLLPAPAGHGIVFRRTDVTTGDATIPALWQSVVETRHCTVIGNRQGVTVSTVEHLMAAFAGTGIDNALVALDGPEVPIMDGSAAPLVFLIQSAGIREQSAPKRFLRLKQPVQVSDGDKWARLEPYNGFRLNFHIDFDHPLVKATAQTASVEFSTAAYIREVSRARTFGFMREFEYLRANKLALGASLENAVAVDQFRVLNQDGLRYADEFVRHKILDAVGDLYLLGHPLLGAYTAFKSGHALNNRLARALLADESAWELVIFDEEPSTVSAFYPRPSAVLA
jgi:UDP-3-O-[3-hydroxymyristoyl] N-acetylglucosamine deacetylase